LVHPPLMAGPSAPHLSMCQTTPELVCVFFGLGPQGKKLQGKRGLSTANMRQICQKERERERERERVCVCVSLICINSR
jgi:hypothetical protein